MPMICHHVSELNARAAADTSPSLRSNVDERNAANSGLVLFVDMKGAFADIKDAGV